MKKLLIGLVALVALIVAAVAAVPFLVPTDAVTRRVIALVEEQTGRDLAIGGPVDLAFFPSIAVRLNDVRLSNAEGSSTEDMIRLGELAAEVALLPLLGGEVVIDRFVLREPVIALEIDETGRGNWQVGDAAAAEPAPAEPAAEGGAGEGGRFTLGEARIVDGEITFTDRRTGRTLSFSEVDLALELGDLDGPVSAEGSALFNGQAVTLAASADDFSALTEGDGKSPIRVSVDSDPLALTFEGTVSGGQTVSATGDLNFSVPSTSTLSAWLPVELPPDLPVETVGLTGTVEAAADRVALTGMDLSLDDVDLTGDLSVALGAERPTVIGDLAVTELDLDRFMAAPSEAGQPTPAASAKPPADDGEVIVDLSPLRLVDAQISLDVAGIVARGTEAGSTTVTVRLEDGALDLSTAETEIFGGTAAVELSAAAADPQTFTLAASLDSVDLAPVPIAVEGLEDLKGTVSGDVTARSSGRTLDEILANLEGTGALTVVDAGARYVLGGDAEPIVVSDLDTTIEATQRRIAFRNLAVTADDVAATGQLTVAFGGPRPAVSGALTLGRLDLDRYLGGTEDGEEETPAEDGSAGGASAPAAGWSTEPIDFSALGLVDADLDLSTDGVVIKGIETGPTTLAVDLAGGALDARLGETPVFGGTVAGTVAISGDATRQLAATIDVAGVQAEPLLSRVADFDRLVGTMNGRVDLTASGNSQLEIVRTLGGNGAILFSDGAIKGINIAAMLRNAAGAFDAANRGEAQQTDFAELGGTFRIASGLLTSDDLRMLAPLFRVEGSGRSNIPERTLHFRLVPRLVASLEGQGGETGLGGVAVPIIVSGTYEDVTFTPDLAGAIQNVVRDPAAVDQQLDVLGEQAEQLKDQLEENPEQAIRGLLQGLTGGAAPADQPAAEDTAPTETAPSEPQPQDPAQQFLEGILGNQSQDGQPTDPAEQLRGLFGN